MKLRNENQANALIDIMRMLLAVGANRDAQDNNGQTALHYAAQFSAMNAVFLLHLSGANNTIVDKNGKIAQDCANHEDIKETFISFSRCYHENGGIGLW